MSMIARQFRAGAIAVALMIGGATFATASTTIDLSYGRLPPTSPNQGIASDILTSVSDGTTGALFHFSLATTGSGYQIGNIYFDDETLHLFGGISISGSTGTDVAYTTGTANPADLSSGTTAVPPFTATTGLNAAPDNGAGGAHAIDEGESLDLLLSYNTGFSFSDVAAAIANGSLRVGVRATDPVSSYVNVAPVPLPATGLLMLGALGGLGLAMRRKRA